MLDFIDSGKQMIRVLHHLESCFTVPGLDSFEYEFIGPAFPSKSSCQQICKQCAKKSVVQQLDAGNFDGTQSSSSSEGQEGCCSVCPGLSLRITHDLKGPLRRIDIFEKRL